MILGKLAVDVRFYIKLFDSKGWIFNCYVILLEGNNILNVNWFENKFIG